MKRLFLGLIILLLLIVAAVFLLPGVIDWNDHRDRLAAELERATGRSVSIQGDLNLSLLPTTAFSIEGVTLANLEGGSDAPLLDLESLRVRLRPMALLRGKIEVARVELLRPNILLERLPDGRVNWSFAGSGGGSADGGSTSGLQESASGGFIQEVSLEALRIQDGTLTYRDLATGAEQRIEKINGELSAPSLRGPFDLQGGFSYQGRALAVEVKSGQMGGERLALSLDLGLPEAGGEAALRGHLEGLESGDIGFSGSVALQAGRLARVTRLLGGPGEEIAVLDQSFELEGRIEAGPQAVSLTSERVLLGGQSAEITALAEFDGGEPFYRAELLLPRLDLDELLAQLAPPESGGESAGSGSQNGAPLPDSDFSLPEGMTAELRLSIGALLYRGQVVREVGLDSRLSDGALEVSRAVALLPGGSDLGVTGSLRSEEGQPRFDARIEGASDNLRGLLAWLGVELDRVPRDRLRQASVTAALSGTPASFSVTDLDLRLDLSRLTGGIAVVPGPRPGLGVGVTLDRLDLDAYLPEDAAVASGGSGGAENSGEAGPGGLATLMTRINANLDLRVDSLTYRGITAEQVYLDASLAEGALDLRRLVVGDLAESYLELSGALSAATGAPEADLTLQVTAPDPAALARALGREQPVLERVGPSVLAGKIKGGLSALDLDLQLSALSGTLEAAGSLQPLADPLAFDMTLAARHGQLGGLARALDLPGFERATPGALDLSGAVAGDLSRFDLDLAATLGDGRYAAKGSVTPAAAGPELALALTASHPEARALLRSFGGEAGPDMGALDLETAFSGQPQRFTLTDLTAALGAMTLTGSLSYDGQGARPRVEADLSAPELDLAALEALSGSRRPPAGGGQSDGAASAPKTAGEGGARWSRKAIDVSGLQALDGRLDLSLDRLKADRIVMNKVELAAILDAGLLTLERFEGRYAGGTVTAEGALDARARPNASLSFDATQLSSKPILRHFFDFDRVSGPVTLSGTLNSTGRSEAELVENLSGLGKVAGTLTFEVKEEERLGNLALTILGQKVKELQGVTASANSFFNAFAGRPAELSGSYRIDAGILTSNDLKLESDRARLEDRLRVDLPGWTLETTADLYRNEDAPGQPPYLTLEAKGPLDEPNYRVAGRAFTTPGAATTGGGQQDGSQQDASPQDGGTDSQESGASTGNPLMDQLQKVVPGLVPQTQQQEEPTPQEQQAAPSPEPEPQPEPEASPEPEAAPEAAPEETEQAAPVIPEPKPVPPPKPKRQEPDPDALIKGILEKLTQ